MLKYRASLKIASKRNPKMRVQTIRQFFVLYPTELQRATRTTGGTRTPDHVVTSDESLNLRHSFLNFKKEDIEQKWVQTTRGLFPQEVSLTNATLKFYIFSKFPNYIWMFLIKSIALLPFSIASITSKIFSDQPEIR